MGMDVAAALALLRTERLLSMCLPQSGGGSAPLENPQQKTRVSKKLGCHPLKGLSHLV
jgi:hypothetical protein